MDLKIWSKSEEGGEHHMQTSETHPGHPRGSRRNCLMVAEEVLKCHMRKKATWREERDRSCSMNGGGQQLGKKESTSPAKLGLFLQLPPAPSSELRDSRAVRLHARLSCKQAHRRRCWSTMGAECGDDAQGKWLVWGCAR